MSRSDRRGWCARSSNRRHRRMLLSPCSSSTARVAGRVPPLAPLLVVWLARRCTRPRRAIELGARRGGGSSRRSSYAGRRRDDAVLDVGGRHGSPAATLGPTCWRGSPIVPTRLGAVDAQSREDIGALWQPVDLPDRALPTLGPVRATEGSIRTHRSQPGFTAHTHGGRSPGGGRRHRATKPRENVLGVIRRRGQQTVAWSEPERHPCAPRAQAPTGSVRAPGAFAWRIQGVESEPEANRG